MHEPAPAPSRRELRAFGLTVGAAFVALAALAWWRGRAPTAVLLATLGGALVVGGLAAPLALARVHRAWMALAIAMSRVTTPVLMGVIYFGVVTPIGAALRILRRRPLARDRRAATYWVERAPAERRSDLRRQF